MTKAKTITLDLLAEDAEPILREAAQLAARRSAQLDHITRQTVDAPYTVPTKLEEARAAWRVEFLRAKRMVEAFGVEYEATSEAETMGVYIPDKVLKSHLRKVGAFTFRHIDKSVPDPKNARPRYLRGIHYEACAQAADRVVRRWRQR